MRLFDKIFKKAENQTEQQTQMQTKTKARRPIQNYTKEIYPGIIIEIYHITEQGQMQYEDGSITKIIMARMTEPQEGKIINGDQSDYIGFELPKAEQLSEEILQDVIDAYMQEKQLKQNIYYLGKASKGEEHYEFGNKNNQVQKIIEDIVAKRTKEMQERQERTRQMQAEKERKERERMEQIEEEEEEWRQREQETR